MAESGNNKVVKNDLLDENQTSSDYYYNSYAHFCKCYNDLYNTVVINDVSSSHSRGKSIDRTPRSEAL